MKLNEKGFAISTILYGLLLVGVLIMALLMNTASFNLMTTKDFVDKTEKELNEVANSYYGDVVSCNFPLDKKNRNVCTAKNTGYYKVNLCSGKCATGIIFLVVGQKLYLKNNEIRLDNDDSNSAIMSLTRNYISGSAGSVAIKDPKNDKYDNTGRNITYHYSDKYFINAMITNGSGSTNMTFMGNADKKNQNRYPYFDNVRYVEVCGHAQWSEIQVIAGGKNVGYNKPLAPVLGSITDPTLDFLHDNNLSLPSGNYNENLSPESKSTDCITMDVGRDMNNDSLYEIDQIGVFGSGVQNKITLYTDDRVKTTDLTITGTPMTINNGYYFNAYKNDTWP